MLVGFKKCSIEINAQKVCDGDNERGETELLLRALNLFLIAQASSSSFIKDKNSSISSWCTKKTASCV